MKHGRPSRAMLILHLARSLSTGGSAFFDSARQELYSFPVLRGQAFHKGNQGFLYDLPGRLSSEHRSRFKARACCRRHCERQSRVSADHFRRAIFRYSGRLAPSLTFHVALLGHTCIITDK